MSESTTTTTVNLQVNGQQAADTLANLKKHALDLSNEIARVAAAGDKVTLQKLRKEMKDTQRQIKEMESSTMQVNNVLRRLDKATPRELQKALQTLNKQLDYMERGSEAWNAQAKKIKLVKNEIARMNAELAKSQSWLDKFNNKFQEWQTIGAGAIAAATGAVMAGRAAVQAYADMEAEMANVRKFTGMTAEEVEKLNDEFRKIDTRTSREDLNKLAQEAGRLGKSSQEDVLGFVKAADQINVALDDLGDGATLTLSKLTSIFGDEERLGTERSLLAVGSVINELSQNCTASAPYLAQFAQRLAGVGAQADMTIPEIMGFAAVLDSQGQAVEMSATAMSKVIMNMFKETDKICAATGMNLDEFNAALQRSTNEGLMMLLEQLHNLGGIDVLAPVFKDMGENGARASSVISALAANIDMVRWEQEEASKAFEEATSVTNEFNVQNNTAQAGLDKARKGFNEMAVALGQELLPIMRHVISTTSMTMRAMLQAIKFIKEHKTAIISLTAAIATYTVAVNLALIKEKLHAALIAAKTVALHTHKVAVLLASVAYNKLTGNTIRANAAMKLLNATMASNPWGLLAAAIVGAGVALYQFIKRQDEAQKKEIQLTEQQKRELKTKEELKKLDESILEEFGKQAAETVRLTKIVEDNNISLDQRKMALERLKEIVPDYHASLTEEGTLINNNKEALDRYLESLKASIRAKMNQDKVEENISKQIPMEDEMAKLQKEVEAYEDIQKQIQKAMETADAARKAHLEQELQTNRHIVSQHKQKIRQLKRQWQELQDVIDAVAGQTPATPTPSPKSRPAPSSTDKEKKSNKFQAEDDWQERENALNRIAYAKGEKDYESYTQRMMEIELEYHRKKLAHTDLVGNEQVTIEASYQEALRKQKDHATNGTVEQENEEWHRLQAVLQQKYADGLLSARQYQNAMELLELEHLQKVTNIYPEGAKERLKAEKAYHDTSLKYQMKHVQEDKRIQEQLKQQYFTKAYRVPDIEGYQEDVRNLELVHQQMLTAAGNNKADRLKIDHAYYEAKYQLARKYNVKEADAIRNSFRSAIDDSVEWLNSDAGKAFTESFSLIVDQMSTIFSGLTDLINAELDIQTAKIEDKYNVAVSAAEGNKYKEVQLEKEKEAQIAQAKNEANKKLFAMQVIQAIAQTATSAIAAYSSAAAIPVVGWVMAPIAAAMAVAAGGIQIATIKKQQQAAESTGYAEGGFTKSGGKYEEAGIVHAGEWVASQELLQNPTARAMINTLDYAQRTNTIGSLSAEDVSQSITAPQVLAKATTEGNVQQNMAATAVSLREYTQTMRDLNSRLNDPFITVNTVTGEAGIKKAQDEYNQLMKNKTPKFKRS